MYTKLRRPLRFSAPRTFHVWKGLLVLLIATSLGCGGGGPQDMQAEWDEWDFVRTDSLMYISALALQGQESLTPAEVFSRHLSSERDFWSQWLGLDQFPVYQHLPETARDSVLADQLGYLLADPKTMVILDSVQAVFPWGYDFKSVLLPPLRRLKYHFPDLLMPGFRTHINGYAPPDAGPTLDQTVPTPGYFSLGLHYFLGTKTTLYPSFIPTYIRPRLAPDRLAQAMMTEIAEGLVPPLDPGKGHSLIHRMIREGIKHQFLHRMLPEASEAELFNYTPEQMEWAVLYETRIYKLLIDKLYSSEGSIMEDYIGEKPYTTELSQVSAPRIGVFIGAKMVETYLKRNPDVTLAALCELTDFEAIFREARYRP